jgi:hypothetical protein
MEHTRYLTYWKKGPLMNTQELSHICTYTCILSKEHLQMNDIYADTYNPIYNLITNHHKIPYQTPPPSPITSPIIYPHPSTPTTEHRYKYTRNNKTTRFHHSRQELKGRPTKKEASIINSSGISVQIYQYSTLVTGYTVWSQALGNIRTWISKHGEQWVTAALTYIHRYILIYN